MIMTLIKNGLFSAGDVLICMLAIFPLSILHWRGTWQLQDEYFLPQNIYSSSWLSLTLGAAICTLELLMQPSLAEWVTPETPVLYVIVTRLHLYVHGWAILCYWRGVWNLLDLWLTSHWLNSIVLYAICQLLMILTRTVRTVVGVPLAFHLDTSPNLLDPDIVFRTSNNRLLPFVCDCLFTQFIIVTSSITIWRGIWNVLDAFILPLHHETSDLVCLAAGSLVITSFFVLQFPLSRISAKLDKHYWLKLVFEDAIFLILAWANLMLWRGLWNKSIHHFFPIRYVGSWVSHWIGTVGLMLLQVFNSVGLHGIDRDGTYEDGTGIFPNSYLREISSLFTTTSGNGKYDLVKSISSSVKSANSEKSVPTDCDLADDELSSMEEICELLKTTSNIGCSGSIDLDEINDLLLEKTGHDNLIIQFDDLQQQLPNGDSKPWNQNGGNLCS